MYTKCPECNSVFRVTDEQLNAAEGLVRCGLCDAIFNGRVYAYENSNLPNTIKNNDVEHENKSQRSDVCKHTDYKKIHQQNEDELIKSEKIPTAIRDDFGSRFLSRSSNPVHVGLWTIGSLLLATFFLGQITYWQNMDVLPRSWVDSFCRIMKCSKKIERDLSAIKILNRNIYTHPNVENALMITTSFVNESVIAQPLPDLQVALLDTQGNVVAIRKFDPDEYLVNKNTSTSLMQPNQPVGARLEVFDPGSKVIAYEFEFR